MSRMMINRRFYREANFALHRFRVLASRYRATPIAKHEDGRFTLYAVTDRFAWRWDIGQIDFGGPKADMRSKAYVARLNRYVFFEQAPLSARMKAMAFDADYAATPATTLTFAEYLKDKDKYVMIYWRGHLYQIPDLEVIHNTINKVKSNNFWPEDQMVITFLTPARASQLLMTVHVAYRNIRDSLTGIVWGTPVINLEKRKAPE